jgi:hypothetical protein
MTPPKAQIDLQLMGIPQLKSQMKSISDLSQDMQKRIVQSEEKAALQRTQINQRMLAALREFDAKHVQGTAKSAEDRLAIENKFQRQLYNLNQRAALQQQHLMQNTSGGGFNLSSAGHLAQTAGFYRTGHLLRAAGELGVGTEMSLGGAAAFGGLAVAGVLVEKAFAGVAGAATHLATSLIGAVSQIGGARNLQETIVEGVSTERLAAQIAANVTDNVSTKEVLNLINKTSANGEFTPGQIGAGFSAFKARTGTFGPLKELAPFMANLASVSGLTAEESGGILGQIMTQFPGLKSNEVKQVAMNMWGLGRSGAVELRNAQDITQALGFAGKSGMGVTKGINFEMGMVQLAQRFTGGQSADQAVTGVRRLQEELLLSPGSSKYGGLQGILGGNFLTHDKSGQLVFSDEIKTMSKLALSSYEGKLPSKLIEERGQKALMGITSSLSSQFTPGMSEADKQKIIEDTFTKMADGSMAIDEFDGKLKDISETTEYQAKKAFNNLAIELETEVMPVFKDKVMPAVLDFVNVLKDNAPALASSIEILTKAFSASIPIMLGFAKYLVATMQVLEPIIPGASSDELQKLSDVIQTSSQDYNQSKHGSDLAHFLGISDEDFRKQIIADIEEKNPSLKGDKNLENQPLSKFSKEEEESTFHRLLSPIADKLTVAADKLKEAADKLNKTPQPAPPAPTGR